MASLVILLQSAKLMKSATNVFAQSSQKKFLIPKFVRLLFEIGLALRARPILKLLAKVLPQLYSARSN